MTEIAPHAVEPRARRKRPSWAADNPIVRGVARVRLPIGAKLSTGFVLVAALLAVGYVLGIVALGQSNTRGVELRTLERRVAYEQLLLTDATQLKSALDYRLNVPIPNPAAATVLNAGLANEVSALCIDARSSNRSCTARRTGPSLKTIDPPLFAAIDASTGGQPTAVLSALVPIYQANPVPAPITTAALVRADRFAASITARLATLTGTTEARADALVAADGSSFTSSRNLLIGVGAGSFVLALVLGLLLSWSVVEPIRRTQGRLSEISGGDFAGHVEVPNRDEIGALAADVNRMSEELQRLYLELETASEHKSQFLANMSHELRTPLNAIIGFSEVLHEQMFGGLNERQLAYVEDVLAAGRHLLSLINDVLDLAKIEAGHMELELGPVEVPELLRAAVSMHGERASRGGVALSLETEPDQITVTADERRVRQIVFNLLSNALKFTPKGGRIDVSAHLDDGQVEVAFADTGPGIAADDLEAIFKEFEQTADGKRAEGTGLGLPLSRRFAELHGGRLWAESEPGKGSTFRFTLPVEAAE